MANQYNRVFSDDDIRVLREKVTAENCSKWAEAYNVAWYTVAQAVRGETYTHLNEVYPPNENFGRKSLDGLSDEDKDRIRERIKQGEKQKAVASEYGLSESYISRIKRYLR